MKKGLALFDFDGTITSKDSLMEFIKYTAGSTIFFMVMGLFSPMILYYKFIKKDGEIAKRKVLSFFYKGKSKTELSQLGIDFAKDVIPSLLLPKAIEEINKHKIKKDKVVVISASLDIWLKPWAESMDIQLICTNLEFADNKFTGNFATANCNGNEKVQRIKALLNLEEYTTIYAYGNSHGDKPMLALADHGFYRHFD